MELSMEYNIINVYLTWPRNYLFKNLRWPRKGNMHWMAISFRYFMKAAYEFVMRHCDYE
jgi:hypothetical protein